MICRINAFNAELNVRQLFKNFNNLPLQKNPYPEDSLHRVVNS